MSSMLGVHSRFSCRNVNSRTCSDRRLLRLIETTFPEVELRRSELTDVAGMEINDLASFANNGRRCLFCLQNIKGQFPLPIGVSFR